MPEINKKNILVLAVIILALAGLAVIASFLFGGTDTTYVQYKTPAGETVNIKNFKRAAKAVDGPAVTLQSEAQVATIMYNENSGIFTILVRADDLETFKEKRPIAEQQFLREVGVTREQACKLQVEVSNDGPVGQIAEVSDVQKLSFCK